MPQRKNETQRHRDAGCLDRWRGSLEGFLLPRLVERIACGALGKPGARSGDLCASESYPSSVAPQKPTGGKQGRRRREFMISFLKSSRSGKIPEQCPFSHPNHHDMSMRYYGQGSPSKARDPPRARARGSISRGKSVPSPANPSSQIPPPGYSPPSLTTPRPWTIS